MTTPIQDIKPMGQEGSTAPGEDTRSQAQIDYDEGRGFVERGEPAMAAVSLHNALVGFEEEGNKEGIANASNQLGHACLQKKEYDKALTHYQRAWTICEEMQDSMSLQAITVQLIEVYEGQEQYQEAINRCLDLLDAYHRNNDPKGSVFILERMAKVYLQWGKKDKAADAYMTVASIHQNFKHEQLAKSFREKAEELTQ